MPPKNVTLPGRGKTVNFDASSIDGFARNSICNNYILIIGDEAVLNKESEVVKDAMGNSRNWLDNLTGTEQTDNRHGRVRKAISEKWDFTDIEGIKKEIEPSLYALLATKCFRLVLTTTVDPYIETIMKDIWGENELRILNIYGESFNDIRINARDMDIAELSSSEFSMIRPTLYYVFGKADAQNPNNHFVLTDNDRMVALEQWFSERKPEQLLKYIRQRKIAAIGCNFDDWFFRFFWYSMRGDVNKLHYGQVAVEEKFFESEKKLKSYFDEFEITYYEDSRKFMGEAAKSINQKFKVEGLPRRNGGIFISYASEDKKFALKLFISLSEKGFNVWMDERLKEGDNEYEKRIKNAIQQCKVFVPILSTQVKEEILNNEINDRYYRKEWKWAQEEDKKYEEKKRPTPIKVLPITIGEYNFKESYHKKGVEQCMDRASAFEMPKHDLPTLDSLAKRLNDLLELV